MVRVKVVQFFRGSRQGLLLLFALMVSTLALTGCRSVPVTDRTQLMLTSSSYENRQG